MRPTQAVLASYGAVKGLSGKFKPVKKHCRIPPICSKQTDFSPPLPSPHLPISLATSTRVFVTCTLVVSAVFWMSRNAGGALRDIQKTAARETCTLVNLNLFPQT